MAAFKNSSDSIIGRIITCSFICIVSLLLFGLLLLFIPDTSSNKVIGILGGIAFLITGLCTIYIYVKREGAKIFRLNLILGIIMCIASLLIIAVPFDEMKFPLVCLGIYLISNGVLCSSYGYWLKVGSDAGWLVTFVAGIMLIILGLLTLFLNFDLELSKVIAIFLLINSAIHFDIVLMINNNKEAIMNIFW